MDLALVALAALRGPIVFNVPKESYLPGGRGQVDAPVPTEKEGNVLNYVELTFSCQDELES